jgi:hypothetical protein
MYLTFKILDNDGNIDFVLLQQASEHFRAYVQQAPNSIIVNASAYEKLKKKVIPFSVLIDPELSGNEANLCFRR